MALELKFTAQVDRDNKRFLLTETTGNYSVINPGGWGNPNIARSIIENAILTIDFPDGTKENFNVLAFINSGQINKILGSTKNNSFTDGKYSFSLVIRYSIEPQIPIGGGPAPPIIIVDIDAHYKVLDLVDIFKLPYSFIVNNIDLCKPNNCSCTVNILTIWAYLKALESSYETENSIQTEELYNRISKLIDG